MPEPADKKCEKQISILSQFPGAASSQRYIDIVLQPCAQRDVPSAPEILHRYGKIGMIKIIDDLNAKQFRSSLRERRAG